MCFFVEDFDVKEDFIQVGIDFFNECIKAEKPACFKKYVNVFFFCPRGNFCKKVDVQCRFSP